MIRRGIPAEHLDQAAALYWQAFGGKLGKVMGPSSKALTFVRKTINPDFAISAVRSGKLLGVAGFKTSEGSLVNGGFKELFAVYGLSAYWRGPVLELLERDVENERFLMDGIFVSPTARGKGVGTALLHALYEHGRELGYKEIRLDVIDTNPKARSLYEREGFVPIKTDKLGLLRFVFGFRSSTTMVRPL